MFNNNLINEQELKYRFIPEFFAYNISKLDLSKKIYVKTTLEQNEGQELFVLDDKQTQLLSKVLKNEVLSSFRTNRYFLYDISFRKSDSIGFSFNDVYDYNYIEPSKIFSFLSGIELDLFIKIITKIEKNMFSCKPLYNPIFMIGMVFDENKLKSIKAYIRYDLANAPTQYQRKNIVNAIAKVVNPKVSFLQPFFEATEELEKLGFVFSFIGIDCCDGIIKQFKLYFRSYEEKDLEIVSSKVISLLSKMGLYANVQDLFTRHKKDLWGIALSTILFEYVNGVQLYFYP